MYSQSDNQEVSVCYVCMCIMKLTHGNMQIRLNAHSHAHAPKAARVIIIRSKQVVIQVSS